MFTRKSRLADDLGGMFLLVLLLVVSFSSFGGSKKKSKTGFWLVTLFISALCGIFAVLWFYPEGI